MMGHMILHVAIGLSGEHARPWPRRKRPAFANFQKSLFRRDAETSGRDARAPRNSLGHVRRGNAGKG
jgi:hypothetical protein